MSRSKSLALVFSSLCALAACAPIPVAGSARQPARRTQHVVVQEPMGNPSATEPVRSTVEAPLSNQLMEPDFEAEPTAEPTYDPSPIQNLEDPSADAPSTEATAPPEVPDEPSPHEVVGPRRHQRR